MLIYKDREIERARSHFLPFSAPSALFRSLVHVRQMDMFAL